MINTDTKKAITLLKSAQLSPVMKRCFAEAYDVFKLNFPESVSLPHLQDLSKYLSKKRNFKNDASNFIEDVSQRICTANLLECIDKDIFDRLVVSHVDNVTRCFRVKP